MKKRFNKKRGFCDIVNKKKPGQGNKNENKLEYIKRRNNIDIEYLFGRYFCIK